MADTVSITDISKQLNAASRLVVVSDWFWVLAADGSSVRIPAEFVRAYLTENIKPSIGDDGTWQVSGKSTGVKASGNTPKLRGGLTGIEASYDEGKTWTQIVAYSDINVDVAALEAAYKRVTDTEAARVEAENARVTAESARATAESSRVEAETARNTAESNRAKAESSRVTAETGRVDAESSRVTAEQSRSESESTRESNETTRLSNENARIDAEKKRADAETARVNAETQRETDYNNTKTACEAAAKNATGAVAGAEKVNATLSGSKISVTDRNGDTKTLELVDVVEKVTVTIVSQVDSIQVSGIKVNVYLNNGKTPQVYTTDTSGHVIFDVSRGNYYEVDVPQYANAQPVNPIGYTAVLASRDIEITYMPYNEDTSEKMVATVMKYIKQDDNSLKATAWEGISVSVTYDNKTTSYTTDVNGQVTAYIPNGKTYTVKVDNQDGYYVRFGKNSKTYEAKVNQRMIQYNMYSFVTGIFILDANGTQYTLEEWQKQGKAKEDAIALRIADQNLAQNNSTFCIRMSDMITPKQMQRKQWCTQNLQFESIALNGNNASDANYWNGEQSSFLILQEADEKSLSVPAFTYAKSVTLTLGSETLEGYVMSVGQEYVHIANIGYIQQILSAIYGEETGSAYRDFVEKEWRWTSTQDNATGAWRCIGNADGYTKSISNYVLPVFAC